MSLPSNLSAQAQRSAVFQSAHAKPFKHALKEWAIAIDALISGDMLLLIRKGGIREEQGRFEVQHRHVWLYPTYEHQRSQWLKPPYAQRVEPVKPGWHPTTVPIRAWADITHIRSITEAAALEKLQPFHIWTESFAVERFKWKPRSPLYLLLLRVYRLPKIQVIPYCDAYGGCRSWIDLEREIDPAAADPVISDADYQRQVANVMEAIA